MKEYDWQKTLQALPLLNDLLFRSGDAAKNVDGLNMTQRKILTLLGDRSQVSQAEILPYTDRDKGSVSKVIQSLVEKGYVERKHPLADRRRILLSLTKKGAAKARILKERLFAHFAEVFSVLEEKEIDEFYTALENLLNLSQRIYERLNAEDEK